MLLVDLVSSINHALPRLVAACSERGNADEAFGPNVGYALLRKNASGSFEHVDGGTLGQSFAAGSSAVGILGEGPIGLGACRWVGNRDDRAATGAATFDQVLGSQTICVALPWSEALSGQIRAHRFATVGAETLLVVWRRSRAIERALVYMGHHYLEPIQLCELAAVACISKFHLVRLFASTLGTTPHRFHTLLRLARATSMLRDGVGITQVAHRVGFADHSHLDRSFRILMGMTPTQYQQTAESRPRAPVTGPRQAGSIGSERSARARSAQFLSR